MTDREKRMQEIRGKHRSMGQYLDAVTGQDYPERCRQCLQPYPCDAVWLLAEIERLEGELDRRKLKDNDGWPEGTPDWVKWHG